MKKYSSLLIFIAVFFFYRLSFAAASCHVMVHNSQTSIYATEVSVIVGTDRADSRSAIVAGELVKQLAADSGVRINLIRLEDLPASVFKSDYFGKKSPQFTKNFVDPIERSSGIIFIAPEYDGAVPGILSYYMNHMRLSLQKKQVALVGVSSGKWGARAALDAFKGTLTHRGARVIGDLQLNIENIDKKIQDNHLSDPDSLRRVATNVKEFLRSLSLMPGSANSQKKMALLATALKDKVISLHLNNGNSVEGKLSNVVLDENQQLAYVQFSGPTVIKNDSKIIPGQDTDVHDKGYGMPVGKIKNFKSEWFFAANLPTERLLPGKKLNLIYESGIVVSGTVKKLTVDSAGNLTVLTFSDVVVKQGKEFLFQKAWGDFDIAVGDFVEELTPQ